MATLSLLKLLQNWRKKRGSEFDALLWHQLMPQGKTAIWVHNYSPFGTQQPQTYFGKFTSCMTFYVHKLVCSEPFLDSRCKIWQLLPALYSDLWKKIYKCTSTFLALNYCIGIFLQSLSYLYEVVRTHFFTDFFYFSPFLTAISRKLWRHLTTEMRTVQCISKSCPFWNKELSWCWQQARRV